jgi:rRNA maturation RNase YbeY
MISFSSLYSEFELQNPGFFKNWLGDVILAEGRITGEIQYVFCDDEFLLSLNQTYLNHDTFTDIITFPTAVSDTILSGEIYISIPRVNENARLNKTDFENEIARVLVHGVLHLAGYKDGSDTEKIVMRAKEDYYLNLHS